LYKRIPVDVALKNYTENSRRWKLGLLGVQVLINVFLVVMLLIIGRQYEMVNHSNPGYSYENLYYISMYDRDRQAQTRAIDVLRNLPEVNGVAACYNLPYQGSSGDNVYIPGDNRELFNIADQYECSSGFYDLMDIQFLEGRAPENELEIVVDDKFVARMADFTDWSDGAVGKQVFITGHAPISEDDGIPYYYTITGVYKSYLIGNLQGVDPRPSVMFPGEIGKDYMPHILFKVNPASLPALRAALEQALEGREIEIISYEEQMRAAYADSKKMRNTMALGAVFSLLIALLGLIGFIRDESLRRSKEMAVRKINGATTRDILGVFAKNILALSSVMAVIACVAAYFVAHKWLEQFAEKVSLNPLYFIGGAALVLLIVLCVVVLNCLRIARANPVESLKNE
jgi:putative ABC transport system permease protein